MRKNGPVLYDLRHSKGFLRPIQYLLTKAVHSGNLSSDSVGQYNCMMCCADVDMGHRK